MTSVNMHDKAHLCIHSIMAATQSQNILYPTTQSSKYSLKLVSRCSISDDLELASTLQRISISHARRRQFARVTKLSWQPADTHRKLRGSLYPYAKMLNFGERGYCNIPHNFGIQRMIRSTFNCSKTPLSKLWFSIWIVARTRLQIA
jgi:hypothetical protein